MFPSQSAPLDVNNSTNRLPLFTVLNFLFFGVLWVLQNLVAEQWWPAVWLVYLPTHWIGVPAGVLLVWALIRRARKWLLLNILALGIWLLVFLGFNIPLRWPRTPSGQSVRVLTYNIHYGSGGAKPLARIILGEKPDVVCLQETRAFASYADPIPMLRPHFRDWHMARAGEVTIFSRYPILSTKHHPMPQPSGRQILETVLDVNGQHLTIFNAHIDTGKPGRPSKRQVRQYTKEAASIRRVQVEYLLQKAKDTGPHLLVGDFNNPPRGLLYRRIAREHTDTFRTAGWGLGYTFHAALPALRIDYIWASPAIQVQSCRVLGETASDHWPLVAEIALPNEKSP